MLNQQIPDGRDLFESQLPVIHRVIRHVCHRCGLEEEDAMEFTSCAMLKLIDDEYAVFRGFLGQSSLRTYLTTVILRLALDFQRQMWGKWRPSAPARQMGHHAVRFDILLHRDGYSFDEAVEILRTNYQVPLSRQELAELASRLPPHYPRRMENDDRLEHLAVDGGVEDRLRRRDRVAAARRIESTVHKALQELGAKDRLLFQMRYEEAMTVQQIACALGVAPRPIYRRIERCMNKLRVSVQAQGLTWSDVTDALGPEGPEIGIRYGVRRQERPAAA